MIETLTIEDRLGRDKFQVDEYHAHIEVDTVKCKGCKGKPCTVACPAVLYRLDGGEVRFDYAGCLECGTCRVVCPVPGAIRWEYPAATFGVQFRYG